MDRIDFFRDLSIIIVSAKLCGLIAQKLKVPQVVGEIIAGLLIGPCCFGIVGNSDYLSLIAEIGVVMLMFGAGLETNLKELLKTGPKAFIIACIGVFTPLAGGTLLYSSFYGFSSVGSESFYRAVFIGTIMTATSVGITVQTLKELGHLKESIGTLIMSAAIIDDVIGIIVLTFVIGFKNPDSQPLDVVIHTVLFVVLSFVVGVIMYYVFKFIDKRHPHQRRIPILGLALCMFMAFAAEEFFGIADITGAYVAGLILCSLNDSDYIARKIDINSYMLFGPVFFASIGLKTTLSGFDREMLLFSLGFVAVALITKVIGCGLTAKIMRYNLNDSLKVGVGMMTRGEVALIVAQKGLSVDMLDKKYFASVILLIIVSSISTPIILKLLYSKSEKAAAAVTDK
ncbi:cation:proton antiporter [uncultured Ruminococcus sp.]|uniref:cation:proton antiporter n=1 Tax=uncultured Ruminococcus sp. TaxID=165186 RepID=UPI00260C782F|nr:cation:proton antiporter [uncultured Ruminococcus sp.]